MDRMIKMRIRKGYRVKRKEIENLILEVKFILEKVKGRIDVIEINL